MGRRAQDPQKLPGRVQLPSGRRVSLRIKAPAMPIARAPRAALFSELFAAEQQGVCGVYDGNDVVPLASLFLGDFHAIRALSLAGGLLVEATVELPCKNCDATLTVHPCKALPLGPFRDFELSDPELDATLPLGVAHEIPVLELPGGRRASTATFEARTAEQARPLFMALSQREVVVDAAFVFAMGLVALGEEESREAIAEALSQCDDDAFAAVTDVFLSTHYPLRLGAPIRCESCGARNDVDAPYEREVEPSDLTRGDARGNGENVPGDFPTLDDFAEVARASFEEHVARFPADTVDLVVTDATPACDDGGEPLLGSYVPGAAPDAHGLLSRPTVTVYVRTFRAMWTEEGAFDVAAEIDETIEHELQHHEHHLLGDDPMDDEERAEIAREAQRVHGKTQVARDAARGLGMDIGEFVRRTWLVWLLLFIAGAAALWAEGR